MKSGKISPIFKPLTSIHPSMKITLPGIVLIALFFSNSASAQSFTLFTSANQAINNGDTLTFTTDTSDVNLLEAAVNISNNSSTVKSVMIQRDILSIVPGCDNAFAFGLLMYAPSVNLTPYGFDVPSMTMDSSFRSWFIHYGIPGVSYIKYTFFDELNPNDNAWVILKFEITIPLGQNDNNPAYAVSIFPNPASDVLHIINNEPGDLNAEIYNTNGQLVLIKHCIGLQSSSLSLSGLASGCYALKIVSNDGSYISTTRFVRQ